MVGAMEPVLGIERVDPDLQGGEREMLTQYLDYHRATLRMKCAGLSEEQLKRRAVAPSGLSLLGLVRHLTEVERNWFPRMLDGQSYTPQYWSEDDPDGDFDDLDSTSVTAVWASYDATVAESRRITAILPAARQVGRATCAGSWCTSSRSTPATMVTPTCSVRRSMA
jgi:uncharacterized damage-inducible protein DinB